MNCIGLISDYDTRFSLFSNWKYTLPLPASSVLVISRTCCSTLEPNSSLETSMSRQLVTYFQKTTMRNSLENLILYKFDNKAQPQPTEAARPAGQRSCNMGFVGHDLDIAATRRSQRAGVDTINLASGNLPRRGRSLRVTSSRPLSNAAFFFQKCARAHHFERMFIIFW